MLNIYPKQSPAVESYARGAIAILQHYLSTETKLLLPELSNPDLLYLQIYRCFICLFTHDIVQHNDRQHTMGVRSHLRNSQLALLTNYNEREASKDTEPKDLNLEQLLFPTSETQSALEFLIMACTLLKNNDKSTAFFNDTLFAKTETKMTPGLLCILAIRTGVILGGTCQDNPYNTESFVHVYNGSFKQNITPKEFSTWEKRFYHLFDLIRPGAPQPLSSHGPKQ